MRSKFREQFKNNDKLVSNIWDTAVFVFDANVILNFYRYSDKSRKEFLGILSELGDRIWLPEQAAKEFFSNRLSEIGRQEKTYIEAEKKIDALNEEFGKDRGHPFISDTAFKQFSKSLSVVKRELKKNQKVLSERILNDSILEEIADIFSKKIGDAFSDDELDKLFEDGRIRYECEKPPGYKDNSKFKDPVTLEQKCAVFGDLLVWKQTMNMAKVRNVPVILVTDDAKEDWWQIFQGKTIGPRPELAKEFSEEVNQDFLMYRPDQFLKFAKEHLKSRVSETTLVEIRAERRLRQIKIKNKTLERYLRKRELQNLNEISSVINPRPDPSNYLLKNEKYSNLEIDKHLFSRRETSKVEAFISSLLERKSIVSEKLELLRASNESHIVLPEDEVKICQLENELKIMEEFILKVVSFEEEQKRV